MNRRGFLRTAACGAAAGAMGAASAGEDSGVNKVRAFLAEATLTREEVDRFLDESEPNWARFDAELGYTLRDSIVHDGLDNAYTIGRYGPGGERLTIQFADQPCRLNTYGDSFTMCHQVSDGETWQEYLAAHLGEPIRNFGVGGYGVYQAYRRMVRTELRPELSAPYVILNIWGVDDHYRSIDAWRGLRCVSWMRDPKHRHMFHSNPWAYIRLDPERGAFVERPSLCPTPESLYMLCDADYVYETFREDEALLMYAARFLDIDVPLDPLRPAAAFFGMPLGGADAQARRASVSALYHAYALHSSRFVIDRARAFARGHGKQLMVLLSYANCDVFEACSGNPRPDPAFVNWLDAESVRYVDVLTKHVEDYAGFKDDPGAYVRRYYIGHYSPRGNHFFAFAIKEAVVAWLEPKPPAYRGSGPRMEFEDYLPGLES